MGKGGVKEKDVIVNKSILLLYLFNKDCLLLSKKMSKKIQICPLLKKKIKDFPYIPILIQKLKLSYFCKKFLRCFRHYIYKKFMVKKTLSILNLFFLYNFIVKLLYINIIHILNFLILTNTHLFSFAYKEL